MIWLRGPCPYASVFALQRALCAARVRGEVEDSLLLLEHEKTITHSFTGRGAEFLLASRDLLRERGVVVEPTDRGGSITFHGPGQLVGYPILALAEEERDLHKHLRRIEDAAMRVTSDFGVGTVRVPGRTGVWTADTARKVVAIGVRAASWVTSHGFALNVDIDLRDFDLIVACGLHGLGVTSLAAERATQGLGPAAWDAVVGAAARAVPSALARTPSPPSPGLRILLDRWAAGTLPPADGPEPGPSRGEHADRHPPPGPR